MSARLFANVVYAWLMASAGGDADVREQYEKHIYAPADGLDAANANFWAAIQRAED